MKKLSILLFILFIGQLSFSQTQYGHLNYGTLLSVMPETQKADITLETYQNQLQDDLQAKIDQYKARYLEINELLQNGTASPKQIALFEDELKKAESQLKFSEIQISEKVKTKRQELLQPIILRAQDAIQQVAKERGISMVFDTSIFNAILAATDESDLMPYVLAKLGIDYNK